jgi:hypothetical protein
MLDTDAKIQGLKGEQLESRITWIERMPMQEGRELGMGEQIVTNIFRNL